MDTFHIKLDLDKSKPIINEPIGIRQNDGSVTTIVAEIFDHGQPATDLGTEISFRCIRPNFTKYIDTKNIEISGNTITFKTSIELSKEPGLIKIAHFLIGGDSTQDFLIDVKRGVFFTDDDCIKITSNFKNKIAGDRSNPNWAGSLTLTWIMIDPDNPDSGRYRFTITNTCTDEMTQKNYNDAFKTDKNDIQMKWYQDPRDISKYGNMLAYRFLIKPNTIKMRINNLFPHKVIIGNREIAPDNPLMYKDDGSLDIQGNDHYYATHGYMDNLIEIKADVALTGFTPLEETNLSVKQDNGTYKDISYVSSFELDFRKNRFLTKNNELIMAMPYYYVEPAEPGTTFFVTPHPNIECVQYYLPENTD